MNEVGTFNAYSKTIDNYVGLKKVFTTIKCNYKFIKTASIQTPPRVPNMPPHSTVYANCIRLCPLSILDSSQGCVFAPKTLRCSDISFVF